MTRQTSVIALAGAASLLATAAFAQAEMGTFAQRCMTPELQAEQGRDPCRLEMATMGLRGPTVLSSEGGIDVETTGSVNPVRTPPARSGEKAR